MRQAFTGSLYQLSSRNRQPNGTYVAVNGPHDTFGFVVSSELKEDGEYLHLIRGCKARPGTKPAASF